MLKAVNYYIVECDHPGCEKNTENLGGDYSAYADSGEAHDHWVNYEGLSYETADGTSVYMCEDHVVTHCQSCTYEDSAEMVLDGEFLCLDCYETRISMVG